ncbi:MAG: GNAT family N-acetyltransferase [Cocleimonas sp.]
MTNQSIKLDKRQVFDESDINNQNLDVTAKSRQHIEVLSDDADFLALRKEWNDINDHSLNGNIFVSWEWLYTWWETYQGQGIRKLYILVCRNSENELTGIAPFQIVNNPKKYFPCSRQLLLLGTGETDGSKVFGEYMDLIINNGDETAVVNAFSAYLEKHKNLWDGIKFSQQLVGSNLTQLFQTKNITPVTNTPNSSKQISKEIIENGFRTFIDLPETYKDYLMSLRKKMRNNITRTYSRLESEQSFSIDNVTTDSELKAAMAGEATGIKILAELNRTRRGNMDKNSVFTQPNFELFHQRLVKRLLPLNKVSLRILRFGKEPVAALYSFVDRDTVHAYQSGFETENGHRYSLLTTMLTQEISNSIENPNISRFNFMYSDEEGTYKKRYSGTTERMYDISFSKNGLKSSVNSFIHGPVKSAVKKLFNIS